jgi:hypothetical protein
MLMFQNQGFYILSQNTNSFMKNMLAEEHLNFYSYKHLFEYSRQYKKSLEILAMSLPDITDGFDFEDEQLLSILGKPHGSDQELYEEMLETARKNPLN